MKLQRYAIAPSFLGRLIVEDDNPLEPWTRLQSGAPAGAGFVYAYWDDTTRVFWVVLEHESFKDVCDGCPIPPGPIPTWMERYAHTFERTDMPDHPNDSR